MQWFHLTATLFHRTLDLSRPDIARWLWMHMRDAWPQAIAVTIMPDHLHIVVASDDPEAERQRLARLLGQLGRRFGFRGRISEVPPPALIRGDRKVLARQVRYVALNPCRAGLVRCPLAWPWTTHRDVVGASIDPWVTASRLAAALGEPTRGFAARHHAYVSGDPHARVEGTPMPIPAAPSELPGFTLRDIAEAVAAATRAPITAIRGRTISRAHFIPLAHEHGYRSTAQLADACACGFDAIQRHLARRTSLEAARLCLGDVRLRAFTRAERGEGPPSGAMRHSRNHNAA